MGKKIFITDIDIEHIHSKGDYLNSSEKLEIWGSDLNSLGNLMILESTINKSISNNPFHAKLKRYPESIFKSVKNISQNNTGKIEWTFELAMKRKENEVEKLIKYYF